jgi:NTE family protein
MNAHPFSTLHFSTSDRWPSDEAAPVRAAGERALVLGGGGSLGNAWVVGVVAGLLDAGLDVTDADLVVGTSSGSTAAAMLTSASPAELLDGVLTAAPPRRPAPAGSPPGRVDARSAPDHLQRTAAIIAASQDPADMRRRLGASALELAAGADAAAQAGWRATVASRLPTQHWPDRTMWVVAVDAATGAPVVFDRDSGVDLADAVAASCASGPAYRIGDCRLIDGGYRRSSENADLAAGCERVLVLSPFGGRARAPLDWGVHLAAQVDDLRAGGSRVETILPDAAALEAFGDNMMDLSRRAAAARAGADHGRALAGQLTGFWH